MIFNVSNFEFIAHFFKYMFNGLNDFLLNQSDVLFKVGPGPQICHGPKNFSWWSGKWCHL